MNDPIVSLQVTAVFEGDREVRIAAHIGRAAADPRGEGWACPVEITPVYEQPMSVKGVDAFHATWLAFSLLLKLLGQLKREGVALKSADGTEFPVDAYLAGLGGSDAPGG